MVRFHRLAALIIASAGLAASVLPAAASETVLDYRIVHPKYGDIGTYANVVNQSGDQVVVRTELRVAVRILGIVMFREEADRTERWKGDRLMTFDSVTVTNGTRLQVHGEAKDDKFLVTTPDGTITAPGKVHPSNPWSSSVLKTDVELSTKSGRVDNVKVSGGNVVPVTFDGKDFQWRRFEIDGPKRQFVWLDDHDVVVAFRTEEDGAPVDFFLSHPPQLTTSTASVPK